MLDARKTAGSISNRSSKVLSACRPHRQRRRLDSLLALLWLVSLSASPAANVFAPPATHHTRPLPPRYTILDDGSATIEVCYNASCAERTPVTLTRADFADVARHLAVCAKDTVHNRLQRVRIAVWRMEERVEQHLPVLANDRPVNDTEFGVEGRTDCVDNATNTTTYLHVLRDLGLLSTWTIAEPRVRQRFNPERVHWTATIRDPASGARWSVDSWYRPNGHLPFVMDLAAWRDEKIAWEVPFASLNSTPRDSRELCPRS